MRNSRILAILLSVSALCIGMGSAISAPPETVLRDHGDFDSRSLLSPPTSSVSGFSLANPGRFSMRQSYSLMAASGSAGSLSSGLYLNTVSYRILDPLIFSVDVGFYTPIHSTVPGMKENGAAGSSMILPRMGLEYRPNDRMTVNLEVVNLPDAWKAGYGMGGYPYFYGSRFP